MRMLRRVAPLVLALLLFAASAAAELNSTIEYDAFTRLFQVQCTGLEPNQDYSLLLVNAQGDQAASPLPEDVLLAEQLTASSSGTLNAAIIGKSMPACRIMLGGDLGQQSSPVTLGSYTPEQLSAIELPAQMTAIGPEAFTGCTFTHVYLDPQVKSIGARAFSNCTRLVMISIPPSVTDIAPDAFAGSKQVVIVCVENSAAHRFALSAQLAYQLY